MPAESCEMTVSEETNMSVFLPSVKGPGLSSVALVHFLVRHLNNFIDEVEHIMGVR